MLLAVAGLAGAAAAAAAWAHAAESGRLAASVDASLGAPLPAERARAVRAAAVAYGRAMRAPYDPLMGKYGDPLRRLGFVVCIDVPLRAYANAGLSLPALLREAAREHPDWFRTGRDNPAAGPFFARRVRNYSDLFRHHPGLEVSSSPQAGDLAFFGRWHVGLVTEVDAAGRYKVVEASGPSVFVREWSDEAEARRWGRPTLFGRVREAAARPLSGYKIIPGG